MTAFLKVYASMVLLLGLCACQQPRPVPDTMASQYPFDLLPDFETSDELLPGGLEVCRKLGLNPDIPGRCNGNAVLAASSRQTDRSLWFYKTSTGPIPGTCPHAVDFTRMKAGRRVVTVLCGQPDEASEITFVELDQLHKSAEQLNDTQRKTLAQHNAAVELKHEIACQVATAVSDCD